MKFWRRKLRLAAVAVTAAVALTAAACSSSEQPIGQYVGQHAGEGRHGHGRNAALGHL